MELLGREEASELCDGGRWFTWEEAGGVPLMRLSSLSIADAGDGEAGAGFAGPSIGVSIGTTGTRSSITVFWGAAAGVATGLLNVLDELLILGLGLG